MILGLVDPPAPQRGPFLAAVLATLALFLWVFVFGILVRTLVVVFDLGWGLFA